MISNNTAQILESLIEGVEDRIEEGGQNLDRHRAVVSRDLFDDL